MSICPKIKTMHMGIKMLFKNYHLLFLFICVLKKFYVEANEYPLRKESHVDSLSYVTLRQCDNKSITPEFKNLKFHMPFSDMLFQTKYNVRILQDEVAKIIFVVHGTGLYRLLVSRDSKRLIFLGTLNGNMQAKSFQDAAIIFSRNFWLLVVAGEEQLEVYQLPLEIIEEQNSTNSLIAPIQQIKLQGKYQQMFLSAVAPEQLMLIVTLKFTQINDQVLTFAWMNSYLDPIEDIELPTLNMIDLIGNNTKYIITGRALNQEQKTMLTVYKIQGSSLKLSAAQTLTVNSLNVHAGTFQGRKYLIACANRQKTKCHTLRWSKGQFTIRKSGTHKDMAFERISSGMNLLAAVHGNELRVFISERLDCYHSLGLSNGTDINELIMHINAQSENFIILHNKYDSQSLIRVLEVETLVGMKSSGIDDFEELESNSSHQHLFENTIGRLRSLLLRRRYAMEVFRQIRSVISPKLSNLETNLPVNVESGNIGVLNIVDETLRSPVQILQRIDKMRQRLLEKRIKRSADELDSPRNYTELPAGWMKSLKLQKLKVKNLIYQGTSLADFHLENATSTQPILTITANVTTKSFNVQQLLTRENYNANSVMSANNIRLLKVEKLNVERINNITWVEFYDGLYLKNRDTDIYGRLIFQSNLKVENLQISLLNGLVVPQLFNLKLPQTVNADILISAFFVTNLKADKINGLNFAEDIVFSEQDVLIETPVRMHDISIAGDIVFPQNLNLTSSREIQQLQQFYNGKVIINGSLTLENNINTNHNMTFIWLDDIPLYTELLHNMYLLKNTTQHFEFPVTFGSAKVTLGTLNTNFLNNHVSEHHLLASGGQKLEEPVVLFFMSAEIDGNLTNFNASASQLIRLNENVVKHGDVANITGLKIFQAPLDIDNVLTLNIDDVQVNDLVLKQELSNGLEFTGVKSFRSISVAGKAFVQEELNGTYLNNFKLDELINYDYYFDSLTVGKRIHLASVIFHKINGISFDDIFTKFNIRDDELILQKTFIVEGNVTFDEEFSVEFINDIHWGTYQANLVLNNEHATIFSEIHFQSPVTITRDLKTNIINDMEFTKVFPHILTKSTEQNISGIYTFGNLTMSNVNVSTINDVPTSNLIDKRAAEVIIESDLIIPSLIVNGNVTSALKDNLIFNKLNAQLKDLVNMNWDKVVVHGIATWPESSIDQIQRDKVLYLYKHAVRRGSDEQIITGNVQLTRPIIRKMYTKSVLIKDIDLDFMFRDSLMKNSTETQIVLADKTFIKPAYFRHIEVDKLLNVQIFNDIDIELFNASLYRLSSGKSIQGPLYFHVPPAITNLTVEGTVSGISTAVIYYNSHTPLPALRVRGLAIEGTLQIQNINEMDLNIFLENRITKQGPALKVFGHLTFENLIINENALLQTINGIPLNSLVFKNSAIMQSISGPKHIKGNLVIEGPVHVMLLNDKDLMESYLLSVQSHKNFHFDILTVDEVTFQGGLILPEKPQRSMPEEARSSSVSLKPCHLHDRDKNFVALSRALERFEQTMKKRPNRKIHYLDYDFQTEVLWQRPNETIAAYQTIELPCGSSCQRQLLLIETAASGNRLYIQNTTSNIIKASSNGMRVEAGNICDQIKSSININFNNITFDYELNKYIKSLNIYAFNDSWAFLIVHTIDMHAAHNEVLVLKVDKLSLSLKILQTISIGLGQQLQYVEVANMSTLILTAFRNNEPNLMIYVFERQRQQYLLRQFIPGDFDLLVTMNEQMILSCRHCQNIYIYAYDSQTELYKSMQELTLETYVEQLVVFKLDLSNSYLLVLSKHHKDHYYLYKYAHIQGWVYVTHGYFVDSQMVLPLIGQHSELSNDKRVLLVCGGRAGCSVVKAILK